MSAKSPEVKIMDDGDVAIEGTDLLCSVAGLLSRLMVLGLAIEEAKSRAPLGKGVAIALDGNMKALLGSIFKSAEETHQCINQHIQLASMMGGEENSKALRH